MEKTQTAQQESELASETPKSSFHLEGSDVAAAFIIAALTIPLALGYAEIAGVPAQYGLTAAIVATLVYALISKSRHIVFSLDSATCAVIGSSIVALGISPGSNEAVSTMVAITLVTGLFLILFSFVKAGVVSDFVPTPVFEGFILGVSILVILHQVPLLFDASVAFTGDVVQDVVSVSAAIPPEHPWAFYLSVFSLLALIVLHRAAPRLPAAIIVLVCATIASNVMSAFGMQVVCIDLGGNSPVPVPFIPDVTEWDPLRVFYIVLTGFAIALVSGIESLLCIDMFKSSDPDINGSRELARFGIADMVSALFGCPASSAAVSRTAANIEAGGKTRAASALSGVIILVVVLFASPLLAFIPRCVLAAIVVFAMARLVNYGRIRRYYDHMPSELVVLLLSALIVLAFGAIAGVAGGAAISVILHFVRKFRSKDDVEMGVKATKKGLQKVAARESIMHDSADLEDADELLARCPVLSLNGGLTFYNLPRRIERFEAHLEHAGDKTLPVILDLTYVDSLDATATEALMHFIDRLIGNGREVKIVRGMHAVADEYTRYELGRVLEKADVYPDGISAVSGVKQKHFKVVETQE